MSLDSEETEALPVRFIDIVHVDGGEVHVIFRNVDLDVFTRFEVEVLSCRKLDSKLLDEGCNVLVGDDFAFEFLYTEGRFRNGDLEVVLDLDLAAEPPVVLDFLSCEKALLGREYFCAALYNP